MPLSRQCHVHDAYTCHVYDEQSIGMCIEAPKHVAHASKPQVDKHADGPLDGQLDLVYQHTNRAFNIVIHKRCCDTQEMLCMSIRIGRLRMSYTADIVYEDTDRALDVFITHYMSCMSIRIGQ